MATIAHPITYAFLSVCYQYLAHTSKEVCVAEEVKIMWTLGGARRLLVCPELSPT